MIRIADSGDLVCVYVSHSYLLNRLNSLFACHTNIGSLSKKLLDQKGTGIWYEIIYITLKLKLLNDEIFQRTGLSR